MADKKEKQKADTFTTGWMKSGMGKHSRKESIYRINSSNIEKKRKADEKLEEYVEVFRFPEPGIIFRDITTILQDPDGLHLAIDGILRDLEGVDFDVVVGPESRGFIFGVPVAYALHKGFVPVRKKGKAACKTVAMEYELEYGAAIEMHADSIKPGQKVVIVDDPIATGGTTEAMIRLIENLGGEVVKICFVMELAGLRQRPSGRISG